MPPSSDIPDPLLTDAQATRARQLEKHAGFIGMATGIAHDLNNYITAIQGNNAVIQRNPALDTRAVECGQRINASCELGFHLANQLALYSARMEANPESVDVAALVARLRKATTAVLPRNVVLDVDVATPSPPLVADPELVLAMLVNLVTNAADAMVDRRGLIHVFIRPYKAEAHDATNAFFDLDTKASWLELAVKDAGLGIAPDIRDRIFDPFFSTKIRGRGMGLPEVLGILRMHNGNIIVKSKTNTGTRMRALLPASPH
ncbi:MAG: ATP-binding protein [Verrucomicrobia bacterium]|nr:ATP-binding protein [Verrucomicrobiota bacterium]